MIPYNNVHIYVLGKENPQIIMRTYVLGREILIDPRNNVHMYVPTWYNRSQIIMYVRTYFGKEILIYPRNDIHMYVRIRTYLLGVIDPRNNVHMYVRTYLVPDTSMYIISGVY